MKKYILCLILFNLNAKKITFYIPDELVENPKALKKSSTQIIMDQERIFSLLENAKKDPKYYYELKDRILNVLDFFIDTTVTPIFCYDKLKSLDEEKHERILYHHSRIYYYLNFCINKFKEVLFNNAYKNANITQEDIIYLQSYDINISEKPSYSEILNILNDDYKEYCNLLKDVGFAEL